MTADPQLALVADGRDPETLRDAEYGGTPLPIVRQILTALRDRAGIVSPRTFFEPGSGPAPFCKVAREVWRRGVHTVANDIRVDEIDEASRNADSFCGGPFEMLHAHWADDEDAEPIDVIGSNPPFSLAFEFITLGLELARDVVMVLPDDWYKRTEDRCERFVDLGLDRALVVQMQILGRVAFYGGSGTDRVSYSAFHFSTSRDEAWRRYQGVAGRWRTEMLPMLPSSDRRWAGCRPGCEP